MTPGDTNPGRYSRTTTLSVIVAALIAIGAPAADIYQQFLHEKEGSRLKAYLDGGSTTARRIWTICRGLTRIDGKPVFENMVLTREQCDRYDREEQALGLESMRRLAKVPLSEPALAGIASFCIHNVGEPACKKSTFLRLLNEGKRNEACAQITLWIKDGGKDCRNPKNNCGGQIIRRPQEDELCLVTTGEPQP